MLKQIMFIAAAAAAGVKLYGWLQGKQQVVGKKAHKEALQVWEGEGGNPPAMTGTGKTPKRATA